MNAFQIAERFIQLRKICSPDSWADWVTLITEMIIMPAITLYFVFLHEYDIVSLVSTASKTYSVWRNWTEYTNLKFQVQQFYLHTMRVGGPFIVTNDPIYMPYVFADAVYRVPVGIANSPEGGKLLA